MGLTAPSNVRQDDGLDAAMRAAERALADGDGVRVAVLLAPWRRAGDDALLDLYCRALTASGRFREAAAIRFRQARRRPADGATWLQLAVALNDAGRRAEAADAARLGIRRGADSAGAQVVLARALSGSGDHDGAERGYRAALRRDPAHVLAQRELAQLVWRRTGDALAACREIDALDRAPPRMLLCKANIQQAAGDDAAALGTLLSALSLSPDIDLLCAAVDVACGCDPAQAWRLAERAAGTARCRRTVTAVAQAALATGRLDFATAAAAWLTRQDPADQLGLALLATSYRLAGDARYAALIDYRLVRSVPLPLPRGWTDRDALLGALAEELGALHALPVHPAGMSVRGGSQTSDDLRLRRTPALRAVRAGFRAAIADYVAWLGTGDDPVRRRNTGRGRMNGLWSVRLRPGGRHASHVHPHGWLSSAFYVTLPRGTGRGEAGALAFGEPGVATAAPLPRDHLVTPGKGWLTLFPSYFWHGTVPFVADGTRLTMAFDVGPCAGAGHR